MTAKEELERENGIWNFCTVTHGDLMALEIDGAEEKEWYSVTEGWVIRLNPVALQEFLDIKELKKAGDPGYKSRSDVWMNQLIRKLGADIRDGEKVIVKRTAGDIFTVIHKYRL